jgi:hypothetical protein
MATQVKKFKKYSIIFITTDEYRKEGRSYRFEFSDNSLPNLLLFAQKHISLDRKRVPWGYIAIYKNGNPQKFESSQRLIFLPLRKY